MISPALLSCKLGACGDATRFAMQFPTVEEAWDNCYRGDWMLWLAKEVGVDTQLMTLVKGMCANTVRHLLRDQRSIVAVDTALAFGMNKASYTQLHEAITPAFKAYQEAPLYSKAAALAAYVAVNKDTAESYAAPCITYHMTATICRQQLTGDVLSRIRRMFP